jgi:exosome complex component RRP4
MRTYEDQLQMRALYQEHDLISAEIQNVGSDGTLSLHTRSLKYGKLQNGQLVVVPSSLIKRLNQHYISLPWGIDLILGRNGFIWITRCIPEEWKAQEEDPDEMTPLAETWMRLKARHADTPMLYDEVAKIARVRNSIDILSRMQIQIHPAAIISVYRKSESSQLAVKDMLLPSNILLLTEDLVDQQ